MPTLQTVIRRTCQPCKKIKTKTSSPIDLPQDLVFIHNPPKYRSLFECRRAKETEKPLSNIPFISTAMSDTVLDRQFPLGKKLFL